MPDPSQVKVIVSDVHMGAGNPTGLVNPYEDFHHDDRLAELFRHYATDRYADAAVELILAGDFLDLLKLRYQGRFPDEVDEAIAVDKVRRCILGHPLVFLSDQDDAWLPGLRRRRRRFRCKKRRWRCRRGRRLWRPVRRR